MIKAIQIQNVQPGMDLPMERALEAAAKAGFKYVSMGFGSSLAFFEDNWEETTSYIKAVLDKNGLECVQTHLPYYHLLISAEELDDKMENAIKRCIKASAFLGAKWCVYHPRSAVSKKYDSDAAHEINMKVISGYAEVAKEAGISVALENLPVFPGMPTDYFYTSKYEDLARLHDELNHPNISVCWDFGHAHLTKFDHVEALEYMGDRIKCTHIHNNGRFDDDHYPPSLGNMDLKAVFGAFAKTGYDGPLTLEVVYNDDETLGSYFKHCYDCVCMIERIMK